MKQVLWDNIIVRFSSELSLPKNPTFNVQKDKVRGNFPEKTF